MDVSGASAIVTGAAGGIGAAIAQRLLERGASVVLTDLDADRLDGTADDLAAEHEGRVDRLAGDVTDETHLTELVTLADLAFGDVDIFVANAGVFVGFGLDADDGAWAASWAVNVMSHVRAARLLVPRWLDREAGGCFVSTASAAGLLTQLGSATYTTSKHAALGFSEWLAATYGDRGVQVCCLCPMGVRTAMVEGGDVADDADARLSHAVVLGAGEMLPPLAVADVVLDAVADGRFLALPHPGVDAMQRGKAADRDAWLTGMQGVRRSIED